MLIRFIAHLLLAIGRDFLIFLLFISIFPTAISQTLAIVVCIVVIAMDCLQIAKSDDLNFRFSLLMKVIRVLIKRTKILDEIHADLRQLDDDFVESELGDFIEEK